MAKTGSGSRQKIRDGGVGDAQDVSDTSRFVPIVV